MTKAIRFVLAASLGLAACGSPVEDKGDTAVLHGANGDVTMTAQAPKNLPPFAPIYPGAKILSSVVTDAKTGAGGVVSFVVADKPATVIAYYEKVAAANKLTTRMGSPPDADGSQVDLLSEPGTKKSMTVSVGPTDDGQPGTKVGLSYDAS